MYWLSQYHISISDQRSLKIRDTYSIHRVVYNLFDKDRDKDNNKSGILFYDRLNQFGEHEVIILSNRQPLLPCPGSLTIKKFHDDYLQYKNYFFQILINPVKRDKITKKLVPIYGHENIMKWFVEKSPSWGFSVQENSLQIICVDVDRFKKNGATVTIEKAKLKGILHVTDVEIFKRSFFCGIGRAKTFGCGLLQIMPI